MRTRKPRLSSRPSRLSRGWPKPGILCLALGIVAAAMVVVFVLAPSHTVFGEEPSATAEAGIDPAPLRAWFERQRDIRSIDAAFRQERILRTVRRPITAEGRFRYRAPDHLRWELFEDGEPRTVAVQGGPERLTVLDSKKGTATVFDLRDPKMEEKVQRMGFMRPGLEGSFERFDSTFELTSLRSAEGVLRAEMKFRESRAAFAVFKVTMEIDLSTDHLREFGLWFRDNSRVRIVFGEVRINSTLPDEVFEPDLTGFVVEQGEP